jgi:hypothetical protein
VTTKTQCPAALNIQGEHFPCHEPAPHEGWAHRNSDAEAIWASDRDPLPGMPTWEDYERDVLLPIRNGGAA